MSKLQIVFILVGSLMVASGILLLLFPQIMKFIFASLSILVGIGLIVMAAGTKAKSVR